MAGNAFLLDFLKRSQERKLVLGPSAEGEDMTEVPKGRKGKIVKKEEKEKEKPLENPVHTAIRDDHWKREQIIDYLRSLV